MEQIKSKIKYQEKLLKKNQGEREREKHNHYISISLGLGNGQHYLLFSFVSNGHGQPWHSIVNNK